MLSPPSSWVKLGDVNQESAALRFAMNHAVQSTQRATSSVGGPLDRPRETENEDARINLDVQDDALVPEAGLALSLTNQIWWHFVGRIPSA